jgi:hypothetical protein
MIFPPNSHVNPGVLRVLLDGTGRTPPRLLRAQRQTVATEGNSLLLRLRSLPNRVVKMGRAPGTRNSAGEKDAVHFARKHKRKTRGARWSQGTRTEHSKSVVKLGGCVCSVPCPDTATIIPRSAPRSSPWLLCGLMTVGPTPLNLIHFERFCGGSDRLSARTYQRELAIRR